ncbi:MAG TPA: hypothetical protein VN625_04975, partial [Desulfuromonadaceae bacterium]|nr:hypothetical protein [Desulfuromonadaceae bacterium]
MNAWLIPFNLGVVCCRTFPDLPFLGFLIPGFFGATLAGYFLEREIYPVLRFRLWLRLWAGGLCVFFLSWIVLVFVSAFMPDNFGLLTWTIGIAVFLLLLMLQLGLNIHLLKWLGLIKPASERLSSVVDEVSKKMGIPVRATWVFQTYI